MQVVRFNALSNEKLITPSGQRTTAKDWYEALKLTYKPAIVFFVFVLCTGCCQFLWIVFCLLVFVTRQRQTKLKQSR
jgi:cytochrome oxidase Cu insertion factor (SCO1/SenC/PrrC family)